MTDVVREHAGGGPAADEPADQDRSGDGREPAAARDGHGSVERPTPDPGSPDWRRPTGGRLGRLSGLVVALYLVWWMVRLVLADQAPDAFDAVATWMDSDIARILFLPVVAAAVFHTAEGGRVVLGGFARDPDATAGSDLARGAVVFATWLVVTPAWVVLLRPVLEEVA